jgi:hypothetical protein
LKRDPLPALLSGLFLLLGGFVMGHHELWRDEVQAWLLARDSASVLELMANMKYEGHPILWHLLLMPLTRAFATPVAMQVLHLLLATATVYLFVRWSPFSRLQKVLFCFGYFPFYEYAVISRNYGLCLLLLTAFGCLYPHRRRYFPLLAGILALLCHAHVLGTILATALLGALVVDRFQPADADSPPPAARLPFYAGCALVTFGIVTALQQVLPPAYPVAAVVRGRTPAIYVKVLLAVRALVGGYVPVAGNWNTQWMFGDRPAALKLLFYAGGPLYLLFAAGALRRHRPALLFLTLGTATLLAFFHLKYSGFARHHGLLFLCLVFAVWMQRADHGPTARGPSAPAEDRWHRAFSLSLTALFGVHTLSAVTAAAMELRRPFSQAATATDYLHRHGHDESLLVGHNDYTASSLLGSAVQREIYYPQSRRWGSYVIWNRARSAKVTDAELVAAARELPRKEGQRVLLVLDRPLDTGDGLPAGVALLEAFTGSVTGENFHLYQIDKAQDLRPEFGRQAMDRGHAEASRNRARHEYAPSPPQGSEQRAGAGEGDHSERPDGRRLPGPAVAESTAVQAGIGHREGG